VEVAHQPSFTANHCKRPYPICFDDTAALAQYLSHRVILVGWAFPVIGWFAAVWAASHVFSTKQRDSPVCMPPTGFHCLDLAGAVSEPVVGENDPEPSLMEQSMISDHLVRFGQALKPVLALVSKAFMPHAIAMGLPPAWQDANTRLQAVCSNTQRFIAAAEDIPRSILPYRDCSDAHIAKIVEPMRSAAVELAALLDITAEAAIVPQANRSDDTLHRITRDMLVSMAHWLADLVTMTARPELILTMGHAESNGRISIELSLSLRMPDTLAELEAWLPAQLAYRADYVRAALVLLPIRPVVHRAPAIAPRSPVAVPVAPKTPSPFCSIGGGLLLGWLLGDWFSDD
jgi:hypothetical protein